MVMAPHRVSQGLRSSMGSFFVYANIPELCNWEDWRGWIVLLVQRYMTDHLSYKLMIFDYKLFEFVDNINAVIYNLTRRILL